MWETWREGSFTVDPGVCVRRGSGDGPLYRGPVGETGRGLVYRGL